MLRRPYFIVNPAAAGGRAGAWWARARPALEREFPGGDFGLATAGRDALPDLVAGAAAAGFDIVGVGGDGTHHDLINAIVQQDLTATCTYAPLPVGSGNDWCRTLGVPRHLVRWLEVMRQGYTVEHRIGFLRFATGEMRYFINVAGFAFDAEVVRRVAASRYKHRLIYPALTALHLPAYRAPELILQLGDDEIRGRFHTINLGIGRFSGGGMQLVPHASPTADRLAVTYARDMGTTRIALNGWRFFTDTIGKVRGVTTDFAKLIRVSGYSGVEADGEYLGSTPVVAGLMEARLRVRCGTPPKA